MLGHVAQDTGQRADAEGPVARNGDVVLAAFEGGQAEMAAGLPSYPVAELSESLREVVSGNVTRKPQAVMTSSRTKWSRMTFGT